MRLDTHEHLEILCEIVPELQAAGYTDGPPAPTFGWELLPSMIDAYRWGGLEGPYAAGTYLAGYGEGLDLLAISNMPRLEDLAPDTWNPTEESLAHFCQRQLVRAASLEALTLYAWLDDLCQDGVYVSLDKHTVHLDGCTFRERGGKWREL